MAAGMRQRAVALTTPFGATETKVWSSLHSKRSLIRRNPQKYRLWGTLAASAAMALIVWALLLDDEYTGLLSLSTPVIGPPNATLALLYPSGLIGGYRNQVIRLASLCRYAAEHEQTHLWTPSLLWSTQLRVYNVTTATSKQEWHPIPMEMIFDVHYWNEYVEQHPSSMPTLADKLQDSDCWVSHISNPNATRLQEMALAQGGLYPILDAASAMILGQHDFNPRRTDFLPNVSHCRHPSVYGGGKMAGKLWNDYIGATKNGERIAQQPHVLAALRPALQWRRVANDYCLRRHGATSYLALHARVELEMLGHPCGAEMERNLTLILKRVGGFVANLTIDGVMIMVDRSGMHNQSGYYQQFQPYADENVQTLNDYTTGRRLSGRYPVFECGSAMMGHYYADHPEVIDHGTLLEQAINFDLAVKAAVFVGVQGSSYSNDVWTTRYNLGKGASNYRYSRSGIEAVPGGGLPPPHGNCRRPKR